MENSYLSEFKNREYFHQCTGSDELKKLMSKKKIRAYIGFDCTASSLHVGSLLQIMCLRLLQKHGHQPIVLLGGGTTRIGDPSGKEETRKILSENKIENNIKNIEKVFKIFLKTKNPKTKPIFVNNFKWLGKLNYIKFLREIGKHFTINKMLSFDSVKLRLDREQSLSYMEFNYMILQAYDFLELNKTKNCLMQIGGSDQWGNIVNGIELIRRLNNKKAFAITSPLITNPDGSKMGKTADGAVWLDEKKLSNYDFFQYWRNIDDANVPKFLNFFTTLSNQEISKLSKLKGEEINEAKQILAYEVTKITRGIDQAKEAREISNNLFKANTLDERIKSYSVNSKNILDSSFSIIDAVEKLELVKSRSEIKRIIKSDGIKVNDQNYNENDFSLSRYSTEKEIKISVGKKKIGKIKITSN